MQIVQVLTSSSQPFVSRLAGADVAEILEPMGSKLPARERHARPLTTLRNGE